MQLTKILRILKPESVDEVVADHTITNATALASALMWTRSREAKLRKQTLHLRAEVQSLRELLQTRQKSNATQTLKKTNDFCMEKDFEQMQLSHSTGKHVVGNSTKYNVFICVHLTRLKGVVRIHKKLDCNENIEFSKDPLYVNLIRTKFGPDEFVLNLEGPELQSLTLTMEYRGDCMYDMPFEVSTPGLYHLNLVWVREHYIGAQEGTVGWLEGKAHKPLGEHFFLNLSINNNQTQTDLVLRRHHEKRDHNNQLLPVCDLRCPNYTYIPGRWVYKKSNSSLIFHQGSHPVYHREVSNIQLHTWIQLEDFSWLPTNCAMPDFSKAQVLRSLAELKISFQGDSHMRMLYNSLLTFACGQQSEWSGWESQCGGKCIEQNLVNICMQKDGTASSDAYINSNSNLTFINFGQHFCDGDRHGTFQDYKNHIDRIVSKISNMQLKAKRRLIWHETNTIPFRTDNWIQAYGDQRTNTKLLAYNLYASKEMRKIQIPIIPAFAQTLPLFSGSDDSAHIPIEFITQSSLQFVLLLACAT